MRWLVVGADGRPHNLRLARSLGRGLDEKALDAVRPWRFQPATLSRQPVAVEINVALPSLLIRGFPRAGSAG